MAKLFLLMTIADRNMHDAVCKIIDDVGKRSIFSTYAKGTATSELLNISGLGATEKSLILSVMDTYDKSEYYHEVFKSLTLGCGAKVIISAIQLSSVSGISAMDALVPNSSIEKLKTNILEGELTFMTTSNNEMILIIANQGNSENIMATARQAGARGGTLIDARGTAPSDIQKFFGMSIATEKDVIIIISPSADKNNIMKAVMDECGVHTDIKAIAFSMPISETFGLNFV